LFSGTKQGGACIPVPARRFPGVARAMAARRFCIPDAPPILSPLPTGQRSPGLFTRRRDENGAPPCSVSVSAITTRDRSKPGRASTAAARCHYARRRSFPEFVNAASVATDESENPRASRVGDMAIGFSWTFDRAPNSGARG